MTQMNAEFYNLTQQLQGHLFAAMQALKPELLANQKPLPPLLQIRGGYAESPGWFMIQAAEFEPEPLTVQNLRVRDIYASERIVQALLELLAGERWLDRVGEHYHLTVTGRELIKQLQTRSARLLSLDDRSSANLPFSLKTLTALETSLREIIDLSLAYPSQPEPWCLSHSRRRAPADEAPVLQKISQYCSDFNAFRDDAHMAAWQAYDLAGYVWEAFSLICAGSANKANDVFETLFYRGYSNEEYAEAVDILVKRGWLTPRADDPQAYQVTSQGQQIRAEVEAKTDAYFYAPWSSLAAEAIVETQTLLQQFHDNLQRLATKSTS